VKISREEYNMCVAMLANTLRQEQRVDTRDLAAKTGFPEREARKAIWDARQVVVQTDRIVFGPVKSGLCPYLLHRLDAVQTQGQVRRQVAAAHRKIRRAQDKLAVVVETAEDSAERERAARAHARLAEGQSREERRAKLQP
jgi:hypothetical protein